MVLNNIKFSLIYCAKIQKYVSKNGYIFVFSSKKSYIVVTFKLFIVISWIYYDRICTTSNGGRE